MRSSTVAVASLPRRGRDRSRRCRACPSTSCRRRRSRPRAPSAPAAVGDSGGSTRHARHDARVARATRTAPSCATPPPRTSPPSTPVRRSSTRRRPSPSSSAPSERCPVRPGEQIGVGPAAVVDTRRQHLGRAAGCASSGAPLVPITPSAMVRSASRARRVGASKPSNARRPTRASSRPGARRRAARADRRAARGTAPDRRARCSDAGGHAVGLDPDRDTRSPPRLRRPA